MPVIGAVLRSFWTRLAITVAVLAYLLAGMNPREIVQVVADANVQFFAVTLLLVGADRLVMAWRWSMLLRSAGAEVGFRQALEIFFVSSFVGSFLPAGVGADIGRAYAVVAEGADTAEAIASIVIDRALGMLAIGLLGIAGIAAWSARTDGDVVRAVVAAVCLGLLAIVALLWSDRMLRVMLRAGSRRGGRLFQLVDAMGRYRGRRTTLFWVLMLSVLVQVLRILQAYFLGIGLDIAIGFDYYLVFMPVALLLLLLPVSISGFGMPQGAIVWLLEPMGVPAERAFALSTLIIVSAFIGNLPGVWIYLRRRDRDSGSGIRDQA